MKGVVITKLNQSSLGHQYNIDADAFDDMLPIGWVLVAEFGGEWYEGVLTQSDFDLAFDKGDALDNDYFIITRKPSLI